MKKSRGTQKGISILLVLAMMVSNLSMTGFAHPENTVESETIRQEELETKKNEQEETKQLETGETTLESEISYEGDDKKEESSSKEPLQKASVISEDGEFNFLTPSTYPKYYQEEVVSDHTVYHFEGRDKTKYYRVYGKVDELEGFFSCDEYGSTINQMEVINLDEEFVTIAPYELESLELPEELPNPEYEKENQLSMDKGYDVYSYPDSKNGKQYRVYGKIKNTNDIEASLGWYIADSSGNIMYDQGMVKDIKIDTDNLWNKGFIEKPATKAPDFYGNPKASSHLETIQERSAIWSYTDRTGTNRYRVYGSIAGQEEGFYESDEFGNVGHPIVKVDLEYEEKYLKPAATQPGGVLVPDEALITEVTLNKVIDGTSPFDGDNAAGNDQDNSNKVVRSFDNITYVFSYSMGLQANSIYTSFEEGTAYIRLELPTTSDNAVFDYTSMLWLDQSFIKVETIDGKQILTGKQKLTKGAEGRAIPGTKNDLNIEVKVLGASNGDVIKPNVTVWLEGNEPNPEDESHEAKFMEFDDVTVSAYPKYNLVLGRSGYLAYKDTFDFDTGEPATANSTNTKKGRLYGYAVTIQLYNDNAQKGVKGVEVPKGPITFDLDLKAEKVKGTNRIDVTNEYTPLLWDYKENNYDSNRGYLNRNMKWNNQMNTVVGTLLAPTSSKYERPPAKNTVVKGGGFTAEQKGSTISITVDEYAFGQYMFPQFAVGQNMSSSPIKYGNHIGCFSAGYFELLAQFPESGMEEADLYFTIADKNLKATSKSGISVEGTQSYTKDDSVSIQVPINSPGTYSRYNWVTPQNKKGSSPTRNGLYSEYTQGDAWTTQGSNIRLWGGYSVGAVNDKENWAYSVNILQKFDDEAFEIPLDSKGVPEDLFHEKVDPSNFDWKMLYAAKPDGSGWSSDSEMDQAMEEDFIYYGSIAELNAAGKTCVAVLLEGRDGIGRSGIQDYIGFNINVKSTAEVGKVYQSTNEVRIWTEENQLTKDQTRLNPDTVYPQYATVYKDYNKSVYKDGQIVSGHTGSYVNGQSILIVGAQATINKTIEQKSGSDQKRIYSMNDGERRVDYALAPALSIKKEGSASSTVTVTDILPKNVTYIAGSSILGGTYVVGATSNDGRIDGGIVYEPSVEVKSDGTQVLTWTFPDTKANEPMDIIHFSCEIGTPGNESTDVKNNEEFLNYVKVNSDSDSRAINSANGNESSISFRVSKYGSTQFVKTVEKPRYELGDDVVYQVSYDNSSANDMTGVKLVDVLPYIGDGRYTQFHGSYWLKEVEIDYEKAKTSDLKFYYTTDQVVRGQDASTVDISTWTQVDGVIENGKIRYFIGGEDKKIRPTAIAVTGKVSGQESIRLRIPITPEDNAPSDAYGNSATVISDGKAQVISTNVVQAKIVRRTIEGVAWLDANRNGKRDPGEIRLPGIKVVLRDKDGTPILEDIKGTPFGEVQTDANGGYRFTNLPEGEYQVTFENSDTVSVSDYILTIQKADGVPVSINSDAQAILDAHGKMDFAQITGLNAPSLEEMKLHDYRISDQDAGFYGPFIFTKTSDPEGGTIDEDGNPVDPTQVAPGQVITYTIQVQSPVVDMKNITITDKVPEGLSFVKGSISYQLEGKNQVTVSDAAYKKDTHTIQWPELDLPKGTTTVKFKVLVEPLPEGTGQRSFANTAFMTERGGVFEYPSTGTVTHVVKNRSAEVEKTSVLVETLEDHTESLSQEDRGSLETPIETKKNQIIEYHLLVKNTGDEGTKSGELIITDPLPKGTSYVKDSMTTTFRDSTNKEQGLVDSTAIEVSKEFTTFEDQNGNPVTGARWVIKGLSDGEEAYLTFRVYAPKTTDDPDTPSYETEAIFTNTAHLIDSDLKELTYEADYVDLDGVLHKQGSPVYPEQEYSKESQTTYHKIREPLVTAVKSSIPESLPTDGNVPFVKAGDTITYTITLKNSGSVTAKDIKVRDYIPAHTQYVVDSANEDGVLTVVTKDDKEVERLDWTIPSLDPEETVFVSFMVTVLSEDAESVFAIRNTGLLKAPDPDEVDPSGEEDEDYKETNEVIHQVSSFLKYANPMGGEGAEDATYLKEGQAITYTLQLHTQEGATGVLAKDKIPEGLDFVPNSIQIVEPDGTVIPVEDVAYQEDTRTIAWPSIDAKKGITRFEFKVVVGKLKDGEFEKNYENQGILDFIDASKDSMQSNVVTHKTNSGKSTIHKSAAVVTLDNTGKETVGEEQTGTKEQPVITEQGQIVEYRLRVDRTSSKENVSERLVVTDLLPEGTTFVEGSITGTFTKVVENSQATIISKELKLLKDSNGINRLGIEWVLTGLKDTEVAELTFRVYAPTTADLSETPERETSIVFKNTGNLEDTGLSNIVYEESTKDQEKGSSVYDTNESYLDTETTYHKMLEPVLNIEKFSDPSSGSKVKADDVITYTILVTNTGEGTARYVTVKDTVPQFTTYVENSAKAEQEDAEVLKIERTLLWRMKDLEPGKSIKVSFQVTIDEMKEEERTIENIAQGKFQMQHMSLEEALSTSGDQLSNLVEHLQIRTDKEALSSIRKAPKTSDSIQWMGFAISLTGAVSVLIYGRKKRIKRNK